MRWFYGNRPWAKEGGLDLIFGGCSHPIDLLRWHMGDVAEVFACADRSAITRKAGFHSQDIFVISLKFVNRRLGRVLGLFGLEQPHAVRPWIEVALYGDKGTFVAKYPQLESLVKLAGQAERVEHYFEDIYHYFQFEGVNHHAGEFVNYTEYFARCLVEGKVPQPDAIDGFKTIATLEAVRESIQTGAPVRVRQLEPS
jgi:predicted dehydrogenase